MFPPIIIISKKIIYEQHKNVNIFWDCRKFPPHPVGAERYNMKENNTILSHYNYMCRKEPKKSP